jgi:TPP-dependent indolepyruvate ferredoxin oxidoreductase alpha subunit
MKPEESSRRFGSGNEAVALAALHAGVKLGTGYPGTPSTEILEHFDALGGHAQWAPNEKVALEVGLGVAFAGARSLVTMKHVGLNVAADPLFTAAYTGTSGGLVIVSADDPGMASSQNEQDNRRFAVAAGVPMLEPADSQEAYDFMLLAIDLSERWHTPILLRMTTRVCHSATVFAPRAPLVAPTPSFVRDVPGRVMIPAYARPAQQAPRNCGLERERRTDGDRRRRRLARHHYVRHFVSARTRGLADGARVQDRSDLSVAPRNHAPLRPRCEAMSSRRRGRPVSVRSNTRGRYRRRKNS